MSICILIHLLQHELRSNQSALNCKLWQNTDPSKYVLQFLLRVLRIDTISSVQQLEIYFRPCRRRILYFNWLRFFWNAFRWLCFARLTRKNNQNVTTWTLVLGDIFQSDADLSIQLLLRGLRNSYWRPIRDPVWLEVELFKEYKSQGEFLTGPTAFLVQQWP